MESKDSLIYSTIK